MDAILKLCFELKCIQSFSTWNIHPDLTQKFQSHEIYICPIWHTSLPNQSSPARVSNWKFKMVRNFCSGKCFKYCCQACYIIIVLHNNCACCRHVYIIIVQLLHIPGANTTESVVCPFFSIFCHREECSSVINFGSGWIMVVCCIFGWTALNLNFPQ